MGLSRMSRAGRREGGRNVRGEALLGEGEVEGGAWNYKGRLPQPDCAVMEGVR